MICCRSFFHHFFCKPAPPYTVDLCTTHHQLDTKITFPILCSNLSKAPPSPSLPCLPSKCKSQISVKFSGWVRQDFKRSWLLLTRRYSMQGNISCGAAGNWINQNSFWPTYMIQKSRKYQKRKSHKRGESEMILPSSFTFLRKEALRRLRRLPWVWSDGLSPFTFTPVFQHYPKVAAVTSHRQQTYSQQKVYIELDNLQLCETQIFRLWVDSAIFKILEPSVFEKYSIHWVFEAPCICLCLCVFVFLYVFVGYCHH